MLFSCSLDLLICWFTFFLFFFLPILSRLQTLPPPPPDPGSYLLWRGVLLVIFFCHVRMHARTNGWRNRLSLGVKIGIGAGAAVAVILLGATGFGIMKARRSST